ncbi:MAG: hypothetical protein R2747_15985 [Pyrinomonadaceae bacterium]
MLLLLGLILNQMIEKVILPESYHLKERSENKKNRLLLLLPDLKLKVLFYEVGRVLSDLKSCLKFEKVFGFFRSSEPSDSPKSVLSHGTAEKIRTVFQAL